MKERPLKQIIRLIAVLTVLVLALTAAAQEDIEIHKYTNGQDANSAPGPSIEVGSPVTWTYVVSNIGARELTDISVTDDQGVIVTCPATVLDAGVSFTCTASGIATAGQYANIGTVTATRSNATTTTASDPSFYFGVMPVLAATKSDALLVDGDSDGVAEPGDTLRYTVIVTNSGTSDATAVTFTDTPDPNTALVTGSVTTSSGTVTAGNTAGNTSVGVSIGSISPSASVTITFDVTIANPLPPGVTTISNQGTIAGSNVPTQPTDDPSSGGAADPTVTPVVAAPVVTATKSDALVIDGDSDGVAEPGDTLLYTVVIANNGNTAATGVTFTDTPGTNTTLVAGSVTTTAGTVTTGNTAGDTTVQVNAGTLAASGSATMTFRVTINATPPSGTTSVSNQGSVSGTNFNTIPTDDPGTAAPSDPTVTPIALTPVVTATKTAALQNDVDHDGLADGGDTLRYTITVTNNGSADALSVVVHDDPDANTTLVAGSVTTTSGAVTMGNTAGDTAVTVTIPTLPVGGTVTITFDVRIATVLPSGVTAIRNTATVTGANIPAGTTNVAAFPLAALAAVPTLETWGLVALLMTAAAMALWRLSAR